MRNSILIVDPVTAERQYLRELIEHEYIVFESNTHEEAILSLSTIMPNMIILRNASGKAEDHRNFIELISSNPTAKSIIFLVEAKGQLKNHKLNLLKSGIVEILDQSNDYSIIQRKVKTLFAIKNLNAPQDATNTMGHEVQNQHSVDQKKLLLFEHIIKESIENDLEIDLSDIASKLNFSLRSFERFIKKAYKITPVRYVINKRIEKAYAMLHEGQLSIKNIAYQVGFSSITYFNKCFKMLHGVPPGVIIKQKIKN